MTEKPYTDADLRTEAASQYHAATRDRDFMGIGEQMTDGIWRDLGVNDWDAARDKIGTLLTNAADVSEWAVALGAAELEPDGRALNPEPGVRIHFAFGPDVPEDVQRAWIDGIHHAIREGL